MNNILTTIDREIIDHFHKLYYDSPVWKNTHWMGIPCYKCPLDLWNYQEIIYELRPDIIIETGTFLGGSALFMASICDVINKGEIITVDIEQRDERPQHKRITYLLGSSISEQIQNEIHKRIKVKQTILVILDSDHNMEHVLKELIIYGEIVTNGSYLIVEDSNINGHPVLQSFGPGPMEAINKFLEDNKNFIVDNNRENKFYLTFNPNGYLKKINNLEGTDRNEKKT